MEQFSRRALSISALYGLLSILFCLPLFARPFGLGAADWDQQLFYFGEVLKNVVTYRQAPFWSPWQCGGNVMWQHPSVPPDEVFRHGDRPSTTENLWSSGHG